MKNATTNYANFLFKITAKKKSSIIIPSVFMLISIILSFTLLGLKLSSDYNNIIIYSYVFVALLMTVLYTSLKALNIFRDPENEGIELLIFAKPISRKQMIMGKMLSFIYFSLIWSTITLIAMMLAIGALINVTNLAIIAVLSFITPWFTFLIFGMIASLIAYKTSQKIAITIPLLLFAPMAIGGSFVYGNSTPSINNSAYYINQPYKYHKAGNELDVNTFYLANNSDKFFIIPNGVDEKTFSETQNKYIDKVMEISKNSAIDWQAYSWTMLPYQMIDIFNIENKNVFNSISAAPLNNLSNYVNYSNQENILYSYKLNKKPNLLNLAVNIEGKIENKYFVPGMLKVNSTIPNQVDTHLIYAREKAWDFDTVFEEDNFTYSSPNNLVGELNWNYVAEALQYKPFIETANKIYGDLENKLANQKNDLNNLLKVKEFYLNYLSDEVNDVKSKLYEINNNQFPLFDIYAEKNGTIKSPEERKIYLAITLIYFEYFKNNESNLIKSLLKVDTDKNTYAANPINIKIGQYQYQIGGYSSYNTKTEVRNDKVVVRYELEESKNNFLFQTSDQVYAIERDHKIVNKYAFLIIWMAIAIILLTINAILYQRKEYK
ncbi:ABC transporter permease [[Mycoplasma] falconis]|uniref:ABC transporter permease n=1 Tax=[Mycoplasma] falconis TaxID=92403 RepID=A0A501XAK2_9BACT|nr:ABC transporter permease [[Mycoplasma] falconis]TPE57570.1 ABC transporter permease [[Mycoplasma] falconis]